MCITLGETKCSICGFHQAENYGETIINFKVCFQSQSGVRFMNASKLQP